MENMDALMASYGTLRPVSIDEARVAKHLLRASLSGFSWLRGIGIGSDAFGAFVQVNVNARTPETLTAIPVRVGSVPVIVRTVGAIDAQ